MHPVVEVVPHRRGEFGLIAGLFQHFRIDAVDTAEGAVVCGARDAVVGGCLAETRHPALETGIGKGRRRENGDPEANGRGGCDAGKSTDAQVQTHHFLLRKCQEADSSPTRVINQFTIPGCVNENAVSATPAGHKSVT